jgi:rhodanese-related sulfurtransferase
MKTGGLLMTFQNRFLAGSGTVLVLLYWFAAGLPFITAAEHTKDSLETVKKNMAAKKAILVDVREKSEWDDGHLRDAAPLPLSEIPEKISGNMLEKQFPRGAVLYLHCASGRRCLKAADLLMKSGYDVRPLREGYDALLKSGFTKSEK